MAGAVCPGTDSGGRHGQRWLTVSIFVSYLRPFLCGVFVECVVWVVSCCVFVVCMPCAVVGVERVSMSYQWVFLFSACVTCLGCRSAGFAFCLLLLVHVHVGVVVVVGVRARVFPCACVSVCVCFRVRVFSVWLWLWL